MKCPKADIYQNPAAPNQTQKNHVNVEVVNELRYKYVSCLLSYFLQPMNILKERLAGFIFTHPVFCILRPSANSNERMKEWRLPASAIAPAAVFWAPVWTLCRLDIKASHRSTLMRCKWEMQHKLYSRRPPARWRGHLALEDSQESVLLNGASFFFPVKNLSVLFITPPA